MKRCEHCRFWRDTVFKGESHSGWGVWWGDCTRGARRGDHLHSLMPACAEYQPKQECGHAEKGNACRAGACPFQVDPRHEPEPLFPRAPIGRPAMTREVIDGR